MRRLSLVLIIIGLLSCESDNSRLLPNVSGSAGELLLVISDDNLECTGGKQLLNKLTSDYPGLPQGEPIFNVINISHDALSLTFKTFRNILIVKANKKIKKMRFVVKQDVWAKPQTVIYVEAPSKEALTTFMENRGDKIVTVFNNAENERLYNSYRHSMNGDIIDEIEESHNISLCIPSGYALDVNSNNFVWVSHEAPSLSQGIFIYHYPYTNDSTFSREYLINKRNEVLKANVPGPGEGSYMTTNTGLTTFKHSALNTVYASELRGLWEMQNDFMGGPFVSYTCLDSARNRIVTVEGYVYAPKFDKKSYARQVDVILKSLEIK